MRRSFAAFLFVAVLGGCSKPTPNGGPGATKRPVIGVVLPMFRHPFFVAMKDAITAEAERLQVTVDIRDGQDDDQKQIVQVQALLSKGVDAIVLCPRDENAAVAAVEAANRAGVPVVTVNRRVNGGKVVLYVGADDADGGKSQGEALVAALGTTGGRVIYLQGTPGSSPQVNRAKGLHAVIDSHKEITLAADHFTDFQEDKAKSVMSGLVQRFAPGEIKAIVAQADELALPAAEVARTAGWKDVVVIGFNGTKAAFDAIREGTLHATILQDPGEQGKLALAAALYAIHGKGGDHDQITKLPVVTKENVQSLKPSY